MRTVNPNIPFQAVTASRGKLIRAEPVCSAFERGRAHLAGEPPELESELCSYVPAAVSPNRLDGMVWAMVELGDDAGLGVIEFFRGLSVGLFGAEQEDVEIARAKGLVSFCFV